MNLLMFNLAVDQEHVTLGFGLRWIEALSHRYEHVDVVTMFAGRYQLPSNVRVWSVGRERGYSKVRRVLRFYSIVLRILRERQIGVVFTHMIPIFAVLFWPIARVTGRRNVLWYAHGATPPMLRLAHVLVDRVVSSTPDGFRIKSKKTTFIGQGVDADIYRPMARQQGKGLRIITVGRIAPSKGIDLLVDSLAGWEPGLDWRLTVVGAGTSDSERVYSDRVRHAPRDSDRIHFTGFKAAADIAALLGQSDVFVNLSATGSLDKAIVEAMATGCFVISSNDAFRRMAHDAGFPECVVEPTPEALRDKLSEVARMALAARFAIADRQSQVARGHTLDGLVGRLCEILDRDAARVA
jgi:glycosyltransferase involved in cell wall biosynthesis